MERGAMKGVAKRSLRVVGKVVPRTVRQALLSERSRLFCPFPWINQYPQDCRGEKDKKTYNTRDSLVVTDPTTDLALMRLTRGERTGSRTFAWIWSYVGVWTSNEAQIGVD